MQDSCKSHLIGYIQYDGGTVCGVMSELRPTKKKKPSSYGRSRQLREPAMANPLLIHRIRELMSEKGFNAFTLAEAAGTGQSVVYDILRAESRHPRSDTLHSIAKALEVDVAYLIGASDNRVVESEPPRVNIPVIGIAETDAWRVMPANQVNHFLPLRKINAHTHSRYPYAPHFAVEMGDDSMDATKPMPIIRGCMALCVDLNGARALIESGKIYVVRISNGGKTVTHQTIIRRLAVHGDGSGFDLLVESTHKEYVNKFVMGKPTTNPNAPICILGLVYKLEFDLP